MKSTGTLTDSYQVTFDIDGFPYIVDRSIEDGGKNTGTSPSRSRRPDPSRRPAVLGALE